MNSRAIALIALMGACAGALAQAPAPKRAPASAPTSAQGLAPPTAVAAHPAATADVTADDTGAARVQASATGQPAAPPARGPALELALEAAQATLADCSARGHNVGVTVVDSAGVVKVTLAADGASSRGVQSSNSKAVTALTFRQTSAQLGERIKTDADLAARVAANPAFNARAGGVLLQANGELFGAIGVGGARGSENDEACAVTGVGRIQARLK